MNKIGKKIVAFALTGAIALSSALVSFASPLTSVDKFQVIKDLGVIKGEGSAIDGTQIMSRYRAFTMQLRLLGKEEDMNKYAWKGQPSFKDAHTAKGDFELQLMAYLFNHKEYGVIGDAAGLRPYDSVNGKEYAKVMLTTLGYEYGVDYDWNTIGQKAQEVGIVESASMVREDRVLTLEEVAVWSYNTLAQERKGETGKGTLGEQLGFAVVDTLAPEVELEKIADKIAEATITLKGKTEKDAKLTINGKEVEVKEDGSFVAEVALTVGKNKIIMVAMDAAENKAETEIVIEREGLKVNDIKANNLKTIYIEFNQKVDERTVVDANFTIKQNSAKVAATAQLLADGKTVALTTNTSFNNQKAYQVTIDKVKTVDGITMDKATETFSPLDASLPEAQKIEVTGPRNFVIYFDEPIKETGKVEIKYGKNSTLGAQVVGNGTDQVSVKLYRDLEANQTYTVTISDFKDYANYANINKTLEFTYEKDSEAPVANVDKVEQEYVIVSFDKPVSGLTVNHFYHTFTAWKPLGIYQDSDMKQAVRPQDNVSTVYVQFYADGNNNSRPIPEGTTVLGIRSKANGYEIKDSWGNKLEDTELKLNVAADRSKPEVTAISVVSETKLGVTFNKNVTFTKDNVEILNENGNKIDGLRITSVTGSGSKYEISLSKNLSGKDVMVTIKNVEDTTLMNNKMDLYTETITITDKTAPTVDKIYKDIRKVDGEYVSNVLYVQFNEGVDEDTALDANNYYLVVNGNYTQIAKDIEFVDSNMRVRLTLTDAQAALVQANESAQLFVTNIKDVSGNAMKPSLVGNFLNLNTSEDVRPNVKATAVAKDTIEVEFDERLTSVDRHVFTINGNVPVGMSIHEKENKTIVELLYRDEFTTDAKDIEFKIVTSKNAQIVNSFGNVVEFDETYTVADQIAPEVKSSVATGNTITITFSEEMNKDSFSILSFLVRGRKITAYTMEDATLTLTINGDELVEDEKVEIEQRYTVLDKNGNEFNLKDVLEITAE
ncbi:MAG: Ig-like domain-containing protein [Epulopiscium sp.]|nr:Ig-like domain-containing protein [Candidatus Epulonipiscium sp.]